MAPEDAWHYTQKPATESDESSAHTSTYFIWDLLDTIMDFISVKILNKLTSCVSLYLSINETNQPNLT